MKFTFVSLFPNLIKPYFEDSILKRAKDNSFINLSFINPRDFTKNKHKKVDDYMISGGAGLLMSPEPLFNALRFIKKDNDAYFIFMSPVGKSFVQKDAKRLAKKTHIVFVCGRYEGIDERVVEEFADEVLSIGDFVITGGELAALCMSDAISRNINGILGNENSLLEESFENELLEAPSWTKPKKFQNLHVPSEFLKGNHGKIIGLKKDMSICKSIFHRPDLYQKSVKKDLT